MLDNSLPAASTHPSSLHCSSRCVTPSITYSESAPTPPYNTTARLLPSSHSITPHGPPLPSYRIWPHCVVIGRKVQFRRGKFFTSIAPSLHTTHLYITQSPNAQSYRLILCTCGTDLGAWPWKYLGTSSLLCTTFPVCGKTHSSLHASDTSTACLSITSYPVPGAQIAGTSKFLKIPAPCIIPFPHKFTIFHTNNKGGCERMSIHPNQNSLEWGKGWHESIHQRKIQQTAAAGSRRGEEGKLAHSTRTVPVIAVTSLAPASELLTTNNNPEQLKSPNSTESMPKMFFFAQVHRYLACSTL